MSDTSGADKFQKASTEAVEAARVVLLTHEQRVKQDQPEQCRHE